MVASPIDSEALLDTLNEAVNSLLNQGAVDSYVSGRKIRQRIPDAPTYELVKEGCLRVFGDYPGERYEVTLAGFLRSERRNELVQSGNMVLGYLRARFVEDADFPSYQWEELVAFSKETEAPLTNDSFTLVRCAITCFHLSHGSSGSVREDGTIASYKWETPPNIEEHLRSHEVAVPAAVLAPDPSHESPVKPSRASRPIVEAIHRTDWTKFVVPKVGDRVGRFFLIKLLGSGGYGVVWEGVDTSSDQTVAIKIFNPEPFQKQDRDEAAERFHSGAAAMRRLAGAPEIVEVIDGPELQGSYLWFAMRLYPARDLKTWSLPRDPDWRVFVGIVDDVLRALQVAHEAGIVHRDVRPGNILIEERDGRVRALLTDFDIAYYDDHLRARATTHLPIGVLRYLPPDLNGAGEKLATLMRRPGNDLFAVAVVVLDLFTGSTPTIPPNTAETVQRMVGVSTEQRIPKLVARRLASFLARALANGEFERFATVSAFRSRWSDAIRRRDLWDLAVWTGLLLGSLALAMVADWAWHASESFWIRVASSAVSLGVGVASLTGLGAAMLSLFKSTKVRFLTGLHDVIRDRILWRITFGAIVAMVMLGAFWSRPIERIRTARVDGGDRCAGTTGAGRLLRWFSGRSEVLDITGLHQIRCPPRATMSIRKRSILSPLPDRIEEDPVRVVPASIRVDEANSVHVVAAEGDSQVFKLLATEPFPASLPVASTDWAKGPVEQIVLQWSSDYPSSRAEVWVGDRNVGLSLVERGVLNVCRDANVPAAYAEAAKRAQEQRLGAWGAIQQQEEEAHRIAALARCPERCCQSGTLCEELESCEARWACAQCRGDADPGWRLRLDALSVFNEAQWEDVKVCLQTKACGQQCVPAANKGQLLGEFDCSYSPADLQGLSVRVLGTNVLGHEVRVAQTMLGVKLSPKSICQGISASKLEPRNGHVNRIVLSMRPEK